MRGSVHIFTILPLATVIVSLIFIFCYKNSPEKSIFTFPLTLNRDSRKEADTMEMSQEIKEEEAPSPSPEIEIQSNIVAQSAPSPSPSPKSTAAASSSSGGALYFGVNYTVVTYNLGSITVVTDSANDNDCGNDCPVKPLAQYVAENGGRAGINGTYFCPPDYASCAGKVNTYDFPVWNNRHKKWMRADTLFWNGRGMFVFRPGSAQFFPCAACVGAPSDITGGIVNYPSLLSGGSDVLDEGSLSDNLKVTKGTRGGIGIGGGKLFLVVARNANMRDMVNIFKGLGATDALNLDGGGSSALYDGGYKAGPGRALPNVLIIK